MRTSIRQQPSTCRLRPQRALQSPNRYRVLKTASLSSPSTATDTSKKRATLASTQDLCLKCDICTLHVKLIRKLAPRCTTTQKKAFPVISTRSQIKHVSALEAISRAHLLRTANIRRSNGIVPINMRPNATFRQNPLHVCFRHATMLRRIIIPISTFCAILLSSGTKRLSRFDQYICPLHNSAALTNQDLPIVCNVMPCLN